MVHLCSDKRCVCDGAYYQIFHPSFHVILQIKKSSTEKAKKVEKMSKEFAAMEDAAMKAYEEDMKRLKAEAGNIFVSYFCRDICMFMFDLFLLYHVRFFDWAVNPWSCSRR